MNKKSINKIKNPKGPYQLKLKYKGVDFKVIVDNETYVDFDIKIFSDKKTEKKIVQSLMEYLKEEGFLDEATQHNLYW